jgi:glucose/arabinose dehydrogenase/PKD repeat protein
MRRWLEGVGFLCLLVVAAATANAQTLRPGFRQSAAFTGLTQPTAVKFASDGRVFVAEKSGLIKVFDNLSDTTPTVFADLRTNVHNFWDRGLLGLELHPNFPASPYVYVLYTLDAPIGGVAPRWGVVGMTTDPCPTPPGATADGCVVGARLSRLTASGNVATGAEVVFIEDWCQQYPSHSIGSIAFGSDGALYVTGGDGASFNFVDYGQDGAPLNPCGDPPVRVGEAQTPPSAEGGALRSQDLETIGDPVSFGGSVLRLDPLTGAALPDNPLMGGDVADDRIVAYGLRNPFRMTVRPGTNEVWIGDVGWNTWEEINRISSATDATVENFGWPCYEGTGRQSGYDGANLKICEDLYAQSPPRVTSPFYTYSHSAQVVAGETCPSGGSSIAGLAFYTEGAYPAQYDGALFFADYTRDCIWMMPLGSNGLPDPSQRSTFIAGASNPVQLTIGPAGDLFYPDFDGGRIIRVQYKAPTAAISATPTSGTAPLTVNFSAAASSDPDNQPLSFAWDLDDDGSFDDAVGVAPSYTYTSSGTFVARVRVTDSDALTDSASLSISVSNGAPTATIAQPTATQKWRVGQQISFSGGGSDPEEGALPPSALTWTLIMQHCPSACHEHTIQQYPGVSSGNFIAPDHEYPAYLELRLSVRDAQGATSTTSVALQPETVDLTFETAPVGLQLVVGSGSGQAPLVRRVIVGSNNSVSAPSPQVLGGTDYAFSSWSDSGAQAHNVIAPATPATYRAMFEPASVPTISIAPASIAEGNSGSTALNFSVTLSAASGLPITVDYTTSNGTAVSGADYSPASGRLTFGPGATGATITVLVAGDTVSEENETLVVTLSNAINAVISTLSATGTIVNDDDAPKVTIPDVTVTEGNSGTLDAVFTVVLSNAAVQPIEVDFGTQNGSAGAGSDFVAVQGTITIPAGALSGTIRVPVIGDTVREPAETFRLVLSAARNAVIVDGSSTAKINDNDKGKK